MILEIARHVLGVGDADHAETNPAAAHLAITPVACEIAGKRSRVRIVPGTRTAMLYGQDEAVEEFWCHYGVNREYQTPLERAGVTLSGFDDEGDLRIIELDPHPFFVATLFLPQKRSAPGHPHPLLRGFAEAVTRTLRI